MDFCYGKRVLAAVVVCVCLGFGLSGGDGDVVMSDDPLSQIAAHGSGFAGLAPDELRLLIDYLRVEDVARGLGKERSAVTGLSPREAVAVTASWSSSQSRGGPLSGAKDVPQ